MATEIKPPANPRAIAESISGLAAVYDKEQVKALAEGFITSLAPEEVATVTLEASLHAGAAKAVQAAGEIRMLTDTIVSIGGEWTHPQTGQVFVFVGELGDRECKDPEGLYTALVSKNVPPRELDRAIFDVKKIDFRVLNEIGAKRAEWRETIEDFVSRKKPGPPHLKAKE